ncbi:MAG: hypothetical protein ACOCG5_05425 [Candidatus Alkaliphilus sp. MAG34]
MLGKVIPIIIGIFIIMGVPVCAETRLLLTNEEKNYIAEAGVLEAISINGVAPVQYTDTKGKIQGISKRVLEEISDMTGLVFRYKLYDSNEEAYEDTGYDVFFGIPYHYASNGMVLSKPFLKTETILYINSSLESNQLDDKIVSSCCWKTNKNIFMSIVLV